MENLLQMLYVPDSSIVKEATVRILAHGNNVNTLTELIQIARSNKNGSIRKAAAIIIKRLTEIGDCPDMTVLHESIIELLANTADFEIANLIVSSLSNFPIRELQQWGELQTLCKEWLSGVKSEWGLLLLSFLVKVLDDTSLVNILKDTQASVMSLSQIQEYSIQKRVIKLVMQIYKRDKCVCYDLWTIFQNSYGFFELLCNEESEQAQSFARVVSKMFSIRPAFFNPSFVFSTISNTSYKSPEKFILMGRLIEEFDFDFSHENFIAYAIECASEMVDDTCFANDNDPNAILSAVATLIKKSMKNEFFSILANYFSSEDNKILYCASYIIYDIIDDCLDYIFIEFQKFAQLFIHCLTIPCHYLQEVTLLSLSVFVSEFSDSMSAALKDNLTNIILDITRSTDESLVSKSLQCLEVILDSGDIQEQEIDKIINSLSQLYSNYQVSVVNCLTSLVNGSGDKIRGYLQMLYDLFTKLLQSDSESTPNIIASLGVISKYGNTEEIFKIIIRYIGYESVEIRSAVIDSLGNFLHLPAFLNSINTIIESLFSFLNIDLHEFIMRSGQDTIVVCSSIRLLDRIVSLYPNEMGFYSGDIFNIFINLCDSPFEDIQSMALISTGKLISIYKTLKPDSYLQILGDLQDMADPDVIEAILDSYSILLNSAIACDINSVTEWAMKIMAEPLPIHMTLGIKQKTKALLIEITKTNSLPCDLVIRSISRLPKPDAFFYMDIMLFLPIDQSTVVDMVWGMLGGCDGTLNPAPLRLVRKYITLFQGLFDDLISFCLGFLNSADNCLPYYSDTLACVISIVLSIPTAPEVVVKQSLSLLPVRGQFIDLASIYLSISNLEQKDYVIQAVETLSSLTNDEKAIYFVTPVIVNIFNAKKMVAGG